MHKLNIHKVERIITREGSTKTCGLIRYLITNEQNVGGTFCKAKRFN